MFLSTTHLLTFGGPPLLGALIGYLTNKVAIRMLFRPLKPWYILGKRVPMTPGIIPSKRHELAENIGEMVGEQLLTAQDIGNALSAEPFQDHLHQIMDTRIQDFLSRDLGPVLKVVPRRFRAYARIGLKTLKYRMRTGLHEYIASPSFSKAIAAALPSRLEVFGRRQLNDILQTEDREALYILAESLLSQALNDPANTDQLAGWLRSTLTEAAVSGKSLADFLPEELVQLILSTVEEQTPQILAKTAAMLAEATMRERLVVAIKKALEEFIDTLGPMAAMAKGFIDIDSLDETIRTWLEKKEDALASWLQKPEIQERVSRTLAEQTKAFLTTPLANLLVRVDQDKVQTICHQFAGQIMTLLRSENMQQTLSGIFRKQIETMLEHGRIPLADLAGMLLNKERAAAMQQTLTDELQAALQSAQTGELLDRLVNSMMDQLAAKPLGILQEWMPAGVRNGITDYIVLTVDQMLIHEVPGLVRTLNIKELVTEKVDSLDLLRLERLLLSIMEEQFKYINLFGALLGFLIGLLNLLTMLV
ncbi:MAG: DUF445 family protein [Candidatus Electrothrix sp. YB6]